MALIGIDLHTDHFFVVRTYSTSAIVTAQESLRSSTQSASPISSICPSSCSESCFTASNEVQGNGKTGCCFGNSLAGTNPGSSKGRVTKTMLTWSVSAYR